jgi:cation diffusion facilitator CzcD-associated flavoprotein CzcO
MADTRIDIAIIGAGASGIISTHQLVEKLLKGSLYQKNQGLSIR